MQEKFYVHKEIYVHETATVNLSKIFFLKNAKKRCKPNKRDLKCDWINCHHIFIVAFHSITLNEQKNLKTLTEQNLNI